MAGPTGGKVTSAAGKLTLDFPSGALPAETATEGKRRVYVAESGRVGNWEVKIDK
jgi:hypothetical protein